MAIAEAGALQPLAELVERLSGVESPASGRHLILVLQALRELMKCRQIHQALADAGVVAAALKVISVTTKARGGGDDGPQAAAASLIGDAAAGGEGPLRGAVIAELPPLVARLAGASGAAGARCAMRAVEWLTDCCEALDAPLLAAGTAPALVARLSDGGAEGGDDAAWAIDNLARSGDEACSAIMACRPLSRLLDLARGGSGAAVCALEGLITGDGPAARGRAQAAAAAGAGAVLKRIIASGAADEVARDAAEGALNALAASGQHGSSGKI
jgi:hypothetical protein